MQELLGAAEVELDEARTKLKKIVVVLDDMVAKFREDHDELDEQSLQLLKDASQEYQTFLQEKQALGEVFTRSECERE